MAWSGSINQRQVVKTALSMGTKYAGTNPNYYRGTKAYASSEKLKIGNYYFYFGWNPRYRLMDDFTLTTHLSAYKSWSDFIDLIYVLFLGEDVIGTAKIKRLDLAVDIAIPYIEVFKSLQRTNTKRVSEFSSKSRTTYFGNRPDEVAMYEKDLYPNEVDLWHQDAEWTEEGKVPCVRFEARKFNKRIPIKSLEDVSRLWSYQPYTKIQFRKPLEGVIQPHPKRTTSILESFMYRVQLFGFDTVRKEENAKGDFEKRIGKHLGPLNIDLQQAWMNRLERFGLPKPITLSDMPQNPISEPVSEVYSALQS